MSDKELFEFLKKNTNMSGYDIKRHLEDGVTCYTNDVEGFKEFFDNCIAGLFDEEDIPEMWVNLELITDIDSMQSIRVDWVL